MIKFFSIKILEKYTLIWIFLLSIIEFFLKMKEICSYSYILIKMFIIGNFKDKVSIVLIQFSITVYITIVEMSIWNSNQSKVVKERAIVSNCIYLEQATMFYM